MQLSGLQRLVVGLLLALPLSAFADSKTGWVETKTAHVSVKTDLSLETARQAVVLAEQTRANLLAAAWPGSKLDQDRIQLIVFANHQEFEKYFGDFIHSKVVLGQYPPTVFLYGAPAQWEKRLALERPEKTSVLRQALAQHLATFFYRRQPRWFAVGLSEYLETLSVSEDGRTATLGAINLRAISDYGSHRSVGVADALAWGTTFNPTDEGTLLGLHALSWLMVQWMFNTHAKEFIRFQGLLVSGLDPAKAWKVVFPTLVPSDLDRELNHYLQYGSQGLLQAAIPENEFTVDDERPLTSADVHALRAESYLAAGQARDAQGELSLALADDPGNVPALQRQMPLVKPAERLALARRATAAHADDGRAFAMLGDALRESGSSPEETAKAYKKAIELLPDQPLGFAGLAALDVQTGQSADALPLAQTAVRMAPWDATMLDMLAASLAGVGRCNEAIAAEARALAMAGERNDATLRTAYAARMAEMQKSCTEAPAAPALPPAPAASPTPAPAASKP